jgi:hypothetical protein
MADIGMAFLKHEIDSLTHEIAWGLDPVGGDASLTRDYIFELCSLARDVRVVADALRDLKGRVALGAPPCDEIHPSVFQKALVLSTLIHDAEKMQKGDSVLV